MSGIHQEIQQLLEQQQNGRLLTAKQQGVIHTHLADCDACRTYATQLSQLDEAITGSLQRRWATPPQDLSLIMRKVETKQRRQFVMEKVRSTTMSMVVLAVLVFIVFLWSQLLSQNAAVDDGNPVGILNEAGITVTSPAPTVPPPVQSVTFMNALAADFYDRETAVIHLKGYTLDQIGNTLNITFYWQGLAPMSTDYARFVHLVVADSEMPVAQNDSVPRQNSYGTSLWQINEVVDEAVTLSLDGLPLGTYRMVVGWYVPESGRRLTTVDGASTMVTMNQFLLDTMVAIGPTNPIDSGGGVMATATPTAPSLSNGRDGAYPAPIENLLVTPTVASPLPDDLSEAYP